MKKIILLTLLTIVGVLGTSQMVLADSAVLSALPASANSTVGTPFNVSVQINPANNEVCVVKGTLSFSNLTCKSITVASGLMTAVAPTCASPSFTIGIPKCSTASQSILSASVAGTQAGQGSLSFAGIKVVGVGVVVPSGLQGGTYNITAVQTTTPKTTVTQPTQQPTTQQVTTPAQQTTPNNGIPANVGAAALANTGASQWFNWLAIILIILIIIYVIYYFVTRNKKKGTFIKK